MLSAAQPVERRIWTRYPTDLGTRFQPALPGDNLFFHARIRDVSRSGLRLVMNRKFEPGIMLKVVVINPVETRLVHATSLPDGKWALGCAFAKELGQAEIRTLLEDLLDKDSERSPGQAPWPPRVGKILHRLYR